MGFFVKLRKLFSFGFNHLEDAPPLMPEQERGLALGAVYATEACLPINALTMEVDRATAVAMLAASWGVTDARSAREATDFLLQRGHRAIYDIVSPRVERLYRGNRGNRHNSAEAAAIHQSNLAALPGEAVARGLDVDAVRESYESWCNAAEQGLFDKLPQPLPATIMAWDMARVVQLHRLLHDARLLLVEESWNAISGAARLARGAYPSWTAFGDAFVVGRAFWQASQDLDSVAEDTEGFQRAATNLFTHEDSPWRRLPWGEAS